MAVYTRIPADDIATFAAAYGIAPLTAVHGITEGVENTNYRLETETGRYILTLFERRVDPADLPFFTGLMEHLSTEGIPCPRPLHDANGRVVGELGGKPAVIVTFLKGRSPRRVTARHCFLLGQALARLHMAGEHFGMTRENTVPPESWPTLLNDCGERGDSLLIGLSAKLHDALYGIENEWPVDLPRGIIHADLFPDNAFFEGVPAHGDEGGHLTGLIDFYFACTDILAYDVAICINAWCFEPDRSFNVTKARALLSGYTGTRPFSAAERNALPVLARGAAMRFLLTRLFDWLNTDPGALVRPKDPLEYWDCLRFHMQVAGPGAYGLD